MLLKTANRYALAFLIVKVLTVGAYLAPVYLLMTGEGVTVSIEVKTNGK